jgi:hypothetical protein
MKLRLPLVFAFLAAFVVAGCKSSTSPNSVAVPKTVVPGPGSWWKSVQQTFDTSGVLSRTDSSLVTVLDTGVMIYGATSVHRLQSIYTSGGSQSLDTFYRHYEANGDYSTYQHLPSPSSPGQWIRLPYGSQGTLRITTTPGPRLDDQPRIDSIETTFSGAGTSSFTIKGHTYTTTQIRFTWRERAITAAWFSINEVETLEYAPELGFGVRSNIPAYHDDAGKFQGAYHSELVDFELK